jgi:hypothetical protein
MPWKRWLRMITHCKPVLFVIAITQSDWSSYDHPAYPYANTFEPVPIIQRFPAILRNAGKRYYLKKKIAMPLHVYYQNISSVSYI